MSESYYKALCSRLDHPAKDAGIVIGAVIINHIEPMLTEYTLATPIPLRDNRRYLERNSEGWLRASRLRSAAKNIPRLLVAECFIQHGMITISSEL
ncbi:hypothetical protein [Nitrosomonas sp.]|uniref:hypothetical protein n=1 Tax=Nitrosomonas sp. TaxID=42353 RepID=UPI0025FB4756|nr:hypothetical protein [Nitrosomonas sp.]